MDVINTAWSLFPALIAIVLALITKEVYSSLFIGILVGGVLYAGFGPSPMEGHYTNRFIRVDAKTLKMIDIKELCYGVKTAFGCQNAATDGNSLFAIFYNGAKPLVVLDRNVGIVSTPDVSALHGIGGEGFERVPASRAGATAGA